jgi:hypothetical protein
MTVYKSKYYTVEQIDERLLQGFYDDIKASGYTGSYAVLRTSLINLLKRTW